MGNQTSQSQYNQAYGHHEIVKSGEGVVVEKSYVMSSKHEKESFERLLKILKEIRCDTFLNFEDAFESNETVIVQFEYMPKTLETEIIYKKEHYMKYLEKEIVNVLDCVISSLMLLSFKGLHHHRLSPKTIFMRQNSKKYAICYPKLINNKPEAVGENKVTGRQFRSPEELDGSTLTEKSDVFSLGLICLYLSLLEPISSIYSSTIINQFQLFQYLSSLSEDYSQRFIDLLKQMLVVPINDRIDLYQTSQLIQKLIEDENSLKFGNSNSKLMSKRIESERFRELEENGIDQKLPTYCFLVQKEFIDELYGGEVSSKGNGGLGDSRRSNKIT